MSSCIHIYFYIQFTGMIAFAKRIETVNVQLRFLLLSPKPQSNNNENKSLNTANKQG
eukprot:m.44605 g.44605  ORF g.44605 m.44605 type:complete len:57 (-) comp10125_c0_seq1:93-263(-)